MHRQWKNLSMTFGAAFCGALLVGLMMSLPQRMTDGVYAEQVNTAEDARQNLNTAQGLSSAFRNVAEAMRPSVVSISTESTPKLARRGGGGIPPELRRQLPPWLDDDMFRQFEEQNTPQQRQSGMGSGVIIREDGYLLTNNHVVEGADAVKVTLSDGRKLDAKIVGTDPPTDLAVLQVDATGLQAVTLGDSDAIQVGDWVLAIGSPFGLDQTVTAGIISGKNRVQRIIGNGEGFEDFLQTDAAINPGNSGGPLVNLRGEVVGINTAILSRSGANAGIGFAIPVGLARPVVESIIESGSVRRAFLGAQVGDITPEVKEEFSLKVDSGALIRGVLDGQPAAIAGLQPGDVVTHLDGKPIASGSQLRNFIASMKPGSNVEMTVARNGSTMKVTVNLDERTEDALALFGGGRPGDSVIGAQLEPLTAERARELNLEGPAVGLLVTKIEDNSVAAQGGIQVGDVIEQAAGKPLSSVEEFQAILAEAKDNEQAVRMIIRRGNVRLLLVIR
jgi:serine protease Do